MANTHYKLLHTLKEKKANTSAGVSAPTAQPISPIKPAAGMPGSGPLAAGGAGGMSTPTPPVLGGGTGLSSGTDQPAGFVAGMNQQSQEAQLEQEKALGDAQGQAQKLQQDQLNQQAKAQQDQLAMQQQAQQKELDLQVQNQQQVFKKDEELHRTKMELETLKAQTNATQAASAATPGVSPLLPTTAKRIASKANSLMKKMSYGLPSLLAKQAYTYTPPTGIANKQYGGASSLGTSSMQGPKTPTSIAQGRMYNNTTGRRATSIQDRKTNMLPAGAQQRAVPKPTPAIEALAPAASNSRPNNIPTPAALSAPAPATAAYTPNPNGPKLSWSQALQGRTAATDTPEEFQSVYDNVYSKAPVQVGQDPRYFDNRSIRTKIFRDILGKEPKSQLELEKLYAEGAVDSSQPWFKGWKPNVIPGTIIPRKLEPLQQQLGYTVAAIPDAIKNTLNTGYDKFRQSKLDFDTGVAAMRENAPFVSNAEDAPKKFVSGAGKALGSGKHAIGGLLDMSAVTGLPGIGKSLATRLGTQFAAPIAAGLGYDMATADSSPSGLPWNAKAKALELGISPDDPDFYNKLTSKYEQYYNGSVPDSVGQSLQAQGNTPTTTGSTTDANTLQGTGYMHGDKIFNPMQRAVGPYQNMFLNMFTPQPQMYPAGGYNPASMMSAFNDSAQRFGAPAYYDQYRGANGVFGGNVF